MNIGINGGSNYSLMGMQDASKRLSDSAQRVAGAGLPETEAGGAVSFDTTKDVDLAQEAVNQKIASYDFKANAKAFSVQNKMQQDVLNILA